MLSIYASEAYQEDLGICYIASYLRSKSEEVKLIGKPYTDIDYEEIEKYNPSVIGFSLYNDFMEFTDPVIERLHIMFPKATFFVGGATATFYYRELLQKDNYVNFAILGGGEEPCFQLVEYLKGKIKIEEIPQCAYLVDGKVVLNEINAKCIDIEELPFPARDIYEQNSFDSIAISTSRGCVKRCSFCCTNKFWGGWKGESVKKAIEEIKILTNKYNQKNIYFIDGSIEDPYKDARRLRMIAEQILANKLDIYYYAMMRCESYQVLDEKFMDLLKASGLTIVFLGIESGNDEDLLGVYNKAASVEVNDNAIKFFKENNVTVSTGFINFNPYSTKMRLKQNIMWLYKHNFCCFMQRINSRLKLYRGTSIYNKLSEDGLIIDESSFDNNNYRFVNSDVAQINEFLLATIDKNTYIYQLDEMYRQWVFIKAKILSYCNKNNLEFTQLLMDMITQYDNQIIDILKKLNDSNKEWFLSLLEIENDEHFNEIALKQFNEMIIEEEFHKATKFIYSCKIKSIMKFMKFTGIKLI